MEELDGRLVVVPYQSPGATFPPKTLTSIIRQAGWNDDDLRRLNLLK